MEEMFETILSDLAEIKKLLGSIQAATANRASGATVTIMTRALEEDELLTRNVALLKRHYHETA